MDSARSSKIRALALASRTLAREIRRLNGGSDEEELGAEGTRELERLVRLARNILDPSLGSPSMKSQALSLSTTKQSAPKGDAPTRAQDPLFDLVGDGPPGPEHTLVLLGHGALIPIPELVGFLGTLGVDGILKVGTQKELFMVEFGGGQIVHGEASRAPLGQRLGDLLVSQGAIDRIALEAVCTEGASWKLGRRLVDAKLITRDQLERALRAQIQHLFCRLFREEPKSYTFWEGPPLCGKDGVRLNSTSLLLEGARAHDEVRDALRTDGSTLLKEEV